MKLTYKTIDSFVKKVPNDIKGVLVYGPDEGQIREKIALIATQIVPDLNDPFNVIDINSSEAMDKPSRISDEMNSLSLLGDRKLIKISGDNKSLVNSLKNAFEGYDGNNFLIIEGGDLSPSSPVRKLFESEKNLASLPCYNLDERGLSMLIPSTIAKYGKTIDRDAIQYLSSCLVGDSGSVSSALEKLAIYAGDNAHITLDDARACVIDSSDISLEQIASFAANGKRVELERVLAKSFAEDVSPITILRISQTYFNKLHLVKRQIEEDGVGVETAIGSVRPPIFFKDKPIFTQNVNKWTTKRIAAAMGGLIKAETLCKKTGYPANTVCSYTLHSIAKMVR